jgi:hypothetical protein
MAHTSEQRDNWELCGAKKKNGERCRAFAGQGTDHPGAGRCRFHLGNTPTHKASAIRQEAQARALEFDPIPVEPTEALLTVLHLSYGYLAFIKQELGDLTDRKSFEAQVVMRAFNDERDRVARIAKAALEAGVAERHVKLAEQYGALLAQYTQGLIDDLTPYLSAEGQESVPTFVRNRLLALDQRPALTAAA